MNVIAVIILTFFGSMSSILSRRSDTLAIVIIIGMLFSYLIGVRSYDVPDTEAYALFYTETNAFNVSDFDSSTFEVGFQVFTKLLKIVTGGNVILYFFFISVINFTIIYFSVRNFTLQKERSLAISLIFYVAYFGLFYNAIVLRQGIALSLVLFALSNLYYHRFGEGKKNRLFGIFLMLLAVSFHLSAVVGILVYVLFSLFKLSNMKSSVLTLLISLMFYFSKLGLVLMNLLFTFIETILGFLKDTSFSKYLYYQGLLNQATFQVSFKIIFFYLVAGYFIIRNFKSKFNSDFIIFRIYMVGVLLISIFGFIDQVSRILDYFLILSFILLYKEFIKLEKIDSKVVFLFFFLGVQFFFVFRIINGV